MEDVVNKDVKSLTDILREQFKGVLDAAAGFLLKIGLTPNVLTIVGLVGHFAAAFLLARGRITLAGVVLLLLAPADALDGSMARLQGSIKPFGAFLDSVTDRYVELVIFGGLLLYFIPQGDMLACVLVYLAMMGSLMVSYSRARAEAVGIEAKNGIMTRIERYLVLIPSLLFHFPVVGVGIIAVLANITAVQRILRVRRDGNKTE
ncbi:MAG: CDP-alcohol phosphatidyltransferase family protein [Anaerolineaceae bacterium]|nr:CDP-alcohol phosphatidyltransferase family protein [Anaerolineaceae bacterium]